MSHIHSQPGEHDITVSAYIIRIDGSKPTLILHKHKILGTYLQFGGHVEINENLWQAISHELAEESGYDISQLKILQPTSRLKKVSNATIHPCPVNMLTHKFGTLDHYHTDVAYAFVAHEAPAGAIGEGESTDIKAFTISELAALPSEQIPENVREIGLFILEECLSGWEQVSTSVFS